MTSSAPANKTRSLLRGLAVAITCAPARLASCTAYPPTAPPAPLIRRRCPAVSPASSKSACHAVSPTIGSAAASGSGMLVGAGARTSAGARTYSAAAPSATIGRKPMTLSPTATFVTPSPSASTVPDTSMPGVWGSVTGNGPCR